MKRTFLAVVMIATAALGSPAYAEPAAPLSNDQLTQIKQNCVRVKSNLRRIHANDGLVRVNQGQQYEVIATRLMAPLNSRIALNRLDGVELAKTTVEYNTQLTAFRSEYRQYEEKLSELLRTTAPTNRSSFTTASSPCVSNANEWPMSPCGSTSY